MKQYILALLSVFLLGACTKHQKVASAIEGWWTIDTIYYKNYNIRMCLGENSLFFYFNKKSNFPAAENNCGSVITNSFDNTGDISLTNSSLKNDTIPFRLIINTKNQLFSGVYKISFDKDPENHLLKMELMSDNLYIICRKGLFNYDENIDLINDLETITWTNRPKNNR